MSCKILQQQIVMSEFILTFAALYLLLILYHPTSKNLKFLKSLVLYYIENIDWHVM